VTRLPGAVERAIGKQPSEATRAVVRTGGETGYSFQAVQPDATPKSLHFSANDVNKALKRFEVGIWARG